MTYKMSERSCTKPAGGARAALHDGLTFNALLRAAGIAPADVRLLRHQQAHAGLLDLWRTDRDQFDAYQQVQRISMRTTLASPYWASFIAGASGETIFVGLYAVRSQEVGAVDRAAALGGALDRAGTYDVYALDRLDALSASVGKLVVEWGQGYRSWVQRAERQDKPIIELRRAIRAAPFPGHRRFVRRLSQLETMPETWKAALASVGGVYVLACPLTQQLYVGQASGQGGFLGRWRAYVANGHGGNVGLRSRARTDFQVAILEIADPASGDDLDALEALWKLKLLSKDLGLNRN
ncbi:GIY-YIG nuclease family protein [bacterium]|nr:GIY-YIG nuclease family protein [bacterium]